MHTADAVKGGESQARLHLLNAWRETELFTARERAALALTEAVTLVADTHVPDEVYDAARQQFSDKELVDLAYAIFTINAWNRLAITFRMQPLVAKPAKAA
jgi:alkylhydroperoxidase family enzyme